MIAQVFEDICNEIGLQFTYGTKEVLNLALQNFDTTEKTLVALDSPIKRVTVMNDYNVITKRQYTGTLYLIREAYADNAVFNENNHDPKSGEYYRSIVPMLPEVDEVLNGLSICEDITVLQWGEITEHYNIIFSKGVNLLMIPFKIEIEN